MKSILNIGAGKIDPIGLDNNKEYFLVNLDLGYQSSSVIKDIEEMYGRWKSGDYEEKFVVFHAGDVFKFLETCRIRFDKIVLYRFLEHIRFTDVLYLIYLLSASLKEEGMVEVIVPDYKLLADMLLKEKTSNKNFEKNNIILTTELLNDPGSPHASIWTTDRAKYYFEYEKRFKVGYCSTPYSFDGRNIYLYFLAKKEKGIL